MKRKSEPQGGRTLLNLHATSLIAGIGLMLFAGISFSPADLAYEGWGLSSAQCLLLFLFAWGGLFVVHLYSHRFYMRRKQQREDLYFEALRMLDDDDAPTEADARRQTLLNQKYRLGETSRHPSPLERGRG